LADFSFLVTELNTRTCTHLFIRYGRYFAGSTSNVV